MYVSNLQHPWLTRAEKIRLLEYKIRLDLVQYVERGRPPINVDAIYSYQTKVASDSSVRGERASAITEGLMSQFQVTNTTRRDWHTTHRIRR